MPLEILKVTNNPSGDFKSMFRHICKGAWTFSDQDCGWQVSDCTAVGLKVINVQRLQSGQKVCSLTKITWSLV